MSFYLMDGAQLPGIGAWGGSLAYSCSNANPPYNGLVGGYLGLGIDEYGNFLNGLHLMAGYAGPNMATTPYGTQGDNTQYGYGYHPGRIGLRGAGNVAFSWLHTLNSAYYPATLTAAQQQAAVQNTCSSGYLWNYSNPANPVETLTVVADYAPIPNAYVELPGGFQIANESAMTRGAATPITYDLKITPAGLLSLAYSYNGGAAQTVIAGQQITASNGALPASFRFGFAGSTGGDTNIHEILCFKATPFEQSASSAGLNQQQAAQVQTSTQVYLAFYDPANWSGSLTSQNVLYNSSTQTVSISSVANWDASCVLTGVAAGQTCLATGVNGATTAEATTSRTIMTWSGSAGIPFEWANLTAAQKSMLDTGDSAPINANRLNYLRGDRSNEQNSLGVGAFRARVSVLGDIIDSSPTPVGPPVLPYPATWSDFLISGPSLPENAGQSYPNFATVQATRLNVVYAGANDGLLHGFRSGSFTAGGTYVSTLNDGYEVLAYMPGAVLQSAASGTGGCANINATGSVVENIHGATPAIGANAACVQPDLDYSNIQYGHNFYVDATPGTGDLFFNGALAFLARGRTRARRRGDLRARHHQSVHRLHRGQCAQRGPGRMDLGNVGLRQCRQLWRQSRQHLRHTADTALSQRYLGRGVRQWLRQQHRRCGHLCDDRQCEQRRPDVLLPERRQGRYGRWHCLHLSGGHRRRSHRRLRLRRGSAR